MWLRLKQILQTCSSHGIPNKTLLYCFYQGLKPETRRIAKNLFAVVMLNQPYNVVATLLDKMVETNKEAQTKYELDKLVAQVDVLNFMNFIPF